MYTSNRAVRVSEWAYRRLLLLYPRTFRACYGDDMVQVFRDCCHAAGRQRGGPGMTYLWCSILYDLGRSAAREHIVALIQMVGANNLTLKRCFDIAGALVALLVTAPLLPLIALLIKLDTHGPVFYTSKRIGKTGRPFAMYKFRTMGAMGQPCTVTRSGRVLRQIAIDEWPQFFNVLKGDMSFVGPRPELPDQVRMDDPICRQVLSIQPGLCGLAQISQPIHGGQADSSVREALDLYYVQHQSVWLDLRVLVRTFCMLVRPGKRAPWAR